MISVSVAMATCNGEKYIRRQLDSLAAQSHIPAELVITDDTSEDDTISIIDSFAKTVAFPVKVYRNETRLGYRKNFMRAANLCQSELIAFCDQDDVWYPHKIEASVKAFSDPEVLLTYHNADVVTDKGKRIGSLAARAATQPLLTPMSSGPWRFALGFTQVFRGSLLPLSDLWPNSLCQIFSGQPLGHDQWFFFLASVFGNIAYLDEPLTAYVQHGSNAFGWQKAGFRELVNKHFRNHSDSYFRHAKSADSRAVILEIAKGNLEGVWAERAATAMERYRRVSLHYYGQSKLYTSAHLGDRYKEFMAIFRMGGYAGGAWTIGRRSFVTDMCIGVPIGHLLPPSTW